jgi:hypothetical protein
LLLGVAGTGTELVLLGHFESLAQRIPLSLLTLGLAVLGWHAARPSPRSVRTLQGVMALFIVSGGAGLYLHYRGNLEFELEMYPAMRGAELVGKTLTGATPVLAPGTMTMLGLVGLALAHGHPATARQGGGLAVPH